VLHYTVIQSNVVKVIFHEQNDHFCYAFLQRVISLIDAPKLTKMSQLS